MEKWSRKALLKRQPPGEDLKEVQGEPHRFWGEEQVQSLVARACAMFKDLLGAWKPLSEENRVRNVEDSGPAGVPRSVWAQNTVGCPQRGARRQSVGVSFL